jgi:hypothetical protein
VGHHQDGRARVGRVAQAGDDQAFGFGVQVGGRLVEQQGGGGGGGLLQEGGQGQAVALAGGDAGAAFAQGRVGGQIGGQAHGGQGGVGGARREQVGHPAGVRQGGALR